MAYALLAVPKIEETKSFMKMERLRELSVSACKSAWRMGRENPRKFIHALKVGMAFTVVSLLYLLDPLFNGVGENAIWAIMTVVMMLEFTAGSTLYRGLNRGVGTIFGGLLAYVVQEMTVSTGGAFRAVFIGASVFVVGFVATYLRFFPCIKNNYDYGMGVILVTFNLIIASSYRMPSALGLARLRLYTIGVGFSVCLVMSLIILPNWSGKDLHKSTVKKLETLSKSVEVCVNEYFQDQETEVMEVIHEVSEQNSDKKPIDECYKGVLNLLDSKSKDEKLAQSASWERWCTRNCRRYPWQQYVKLGDVLRHFGYAAVALHGCLNSQIKAPKSVRSLFRDPCIRLAGEVSKVLSELATSIKQHQCFSPNILSDQLHEALQDLNSVITSQPRLFLSSTNVPKIFSGKEKEKENTFTGLAPPSAKADISGMLTWWRKKAAGAESKNFGQQKKLRHTLSRTVITSLEFSEALPFAAFASLLVEMVARLDLVIQEVEELGRAANFTEYFVREESIVIDSRNPGRVTFDAI